MTAVNRLVWTDRTCAAVVVVVVLLPAAASHLHQHHSEQPLVKILLYPPYLGDGIVQHTPVNRLIAARTVGQSFLSNFSVD